MNRIHICRKKLINILTFLLLIGTAVPVSAYTVNGTVNYSGAKTGRIYISLQGSNGLGTSIATAGSFSISGVPSGSYTLIALMDTVGNAQPHASNPSASTAVNLSGADIYGVSVTLTDPASVTPVAPDAPAVVPASEGALVEWNTPKNGSGIQIADSYSVEWSTSSGFSTITGSKSNIAADSNNPFCILGGLSGTLYFRVKANITGGSVATSAITGPVTIGTPSGSTITGTITFNPDFTATGPLYVGIIEESGIIHALGKVQSPASPVNYTVQGVPNGTYHLGVFVDMNDDGVVDLGDVTNDAEVYVTVNSGPVTAPDLTMSKTNATPLVETQHFRGNTIEGDTVEGYNLEMSVHRNVKQPVKVTLTGGATISGITYPYDMSISRDGVFNLQLNLNQTRPSPGSPFNFEVTYSDGTIETVQAEITAVLDSFSTPVSPVGNIPDTTPTFSWIAPSSPPSNYSYDIWLFDNNANSIWNSNRIPAGQTSAAYNFDQNAEQSSLTPGNYSWFNVVKDDYGNTASYVKPFTVGPGISFSGIVTASDGDPITGATVEQAERPWVSTSSGADGSFTLAGLPSGSNFTLGIGKTGYVPVSTSIINSTSDINDPVPFTLFTLTEWNSWHVTSGKGVIVAKVVDSGNFTPVSGAVVTASPWYEVSYLNEDGVTFGGSSTSSNGTIFVFNVNNGDTVTLSATKSGWNFFDAYVPVLANAVSEALLLGESSLRTLTVNLTGGGTVNNFSTVSPAFTPCSQSSCTYQYDPGSTFDLGASPADSLAGWSGTGSAAACSGTGNCQFTLNANSTVTAPFNPRAKNHGTGSEYQWLNDAYDAAGSTAQIDARNLTFGENFEMDDGNNITLKGGLASDFSTVSGFSYLQGILTIGTGSLTVENLCIK